MVVRYKLFFLFLSLPYLSLAQNTRREIEIKAIGTDRYPHMGIFSVSVTDANILSVDSNNTNCLTELLLCSEINSPLENSNQFLDINDSHMQNNLDLLLMTQTWRRYDISKILANDTPIIGKSIEQEQIISGHIITNSPKRIKGLMLSVLNLSTLHMRKIPIGDSCRFTFRNMDIVNGESLSIEATKESGSGNYIQLYIDTIPLPKLQVPKNFVRLENTLLCNQTDTCITKQDIYKTIDLPDVQIKKGKKYRNRRGTASRELMIGDKKIERFADMTSMLRWLGIPVRINNMGEPYFGKEAATFEGKAFIMTPTYVDDQEIDQEEIWNILPQNVEQVEYLSPHDPSNIVYSSNAVVAGCLLIYLKDSKHIPKPRQAKPNVAYIRPLGYQPPCEFHSSKGDNKSEHSLNKRATLYWNPKLKTDHQGNAKLIFYSPDTSKRFLVTVEGIAEDGTIISYQTIINAQ